MSTPKRFPLFPKSFPVRNITSPLNGALCLCLSLSPMKRWDPEQRQEGPGQTPQWHCPDSPLLSLEGEQRSSRAEDMFVTFNFPSSFTINLTCWNVHSDISINACWPDGPPWEKTTSVELGASWIRMG